MSAPVFECIYPSVGPPRHDHATLAKISGDVVAGVSDFLIERQILPVWPTEDSIEFGFIQLPIKKHLERNPRAVLVGPNKIETT